MQPSNTYIVRAWVTASYIDELTVEASNPEEARYLVECGEGIVSAASDGGGRFEDWSEGIYRPFSVRVADKGE